MSNHGVFNSLYLISSKVKDDTSDALQTVLNHQSQLLKELLHGSLCPILLNMAGPKKLVLANIEGLTLLLGLLTNHFQPLFPEGHCRVHCSVIQTDLFSASLPSLWQLSLTNTQD